MAAIRRALPAEGNSSGADPARGGRPLLARVKRTAVVALVPAAIATAIALIALRLRFQPPTVATYVGADSSGNEVALLPGGHFEVTVRPAERIEGAVGARGFLLRGDDVRPWDPPFTVSQDGAVRISGPVDTLFAGVPPGPWQVAVAVGRPEVLPTAPNDVLGARGNGPRPAGWHLVIERVRLIPNDAGSPDR